MMFRLKYGGPVEGSFIPWAIGLFYSNPDNRPIPPNIGGAVAARRVEAISGRPDGHRSANVPSRLLEFAVMGQGHSYDARVSGISLIGE